MNAIKMTTRTVRIPEQIIPMIEDLVKVYRHLYQSAIDPNGERFGEQLEEIIYAQIDDEGTPIVVNPKELRRLEEERRQLEVAYQKAEEEKRRLLEEEQHRQVEIAAIKEGIKSNADRDAAIEQAIRERNLRLDLVVAQVEAENIRAREVTQCHSDRARLAAELEAEKAARQRSEAECDRLTKEKLAKESLACDILRSTDERLTYKQWQCDGLLDSCLAFIGQQQDHDRLASDNSYLREAVSTLGKGIADVVSLATASIEQLRLERDRLLERLTVVPDIAAQILQCGSRRHLWDIQQCYGNGPTFEGICWIDANGGYGDIYRKWMGLNAEDRVWESPCDVEGLTKRLAETEAALAAAKESNNALIANNLSKQI